MTVSFIREIFFSQTFIVTQFWAFPCKSTTHMFSYSFFFFLNVLFRFPFLFSVFCQKVEEPVFLSIKSKSFRRNKKRSPDPPPWPLLSDSCARLSMFFFLRFTGKYSFVSFQIPAYNFVSLVAT